MWVFQFGTPSSFRVRISLSCGIPNSPIIRFLPIFSYDWILLHTLYPWVSFLPRFPILIPPLHPRAGRPAVNLMFQLSLQMTQLTIHPSWTSADAAATTDSLAQSLLKCTCWMSGPGGCCCSVTELWPALWDPLDPSMPGFPVLNYLLEFAQTRVHWVGDAI